MLPPYSINVARGDCLNDLDSDGVCDEIDNCPEDYNPNQEDFNFDDVGDACDGGVILHEKSKEKSLITIIDVLGRQTSNKKAFQANY